MNDTDQGRGQRVATAALDQFVGDKASPAIKRAAAEAIAPWAERLVRWLDDFIRIPGSTMPRIGSRPMPHLVPGAGDTITGVGSIALLFLALKERTPTIVILRMLLNILVDVLGGLLPVVGDSFDFVWRSNKRNLELIEKYRDDPEREPTWVDYALVGAGIFLAIASIVIPIVLFYVIGIGAIVGVGSLFGE
ncbi:MAG: DUF4112 domain-containing protein [Sandaracinaceae bacterium]|nr:DUF4112 domain-containing protein [Sandaracinaceae bacterium]